jgi:hypothetical protein
MTRRATFTQAQLIRAVKGAIAAGIEIRRLEIGPDGRIAIYPLGTTTEPIKIAKVARKEEGERNEDDEGSRTVQVA